MIWLNPGRKHNPENCYACQNTMRGMNTKKARSYEYKAVPSAQLPKVRSAHNPLPQSAPAEIEAAAVMSCDSIATQSASE